MIVYYLKCKWWMISTHHATHTLCLYDILQKKLGSLDSHTKSSEFMPFCRKQNVILLHCRALLKLHMPFQNNQKFCTRYHTLCEWITTPLIIVVKNYSLLCKRSISNIFSLVSYPRLIFHCTWPWTRQVYRS
jgi:hypothetical protein